MPRFLTAREQAEMLAPWVEQRVAAQPGLRLPPVRANWLDNVKLTQDFFRRNQYSWIDSLTDHELAQAGLWYPVAHDWNEHIAARHGLYPFKVHATVSATSPQRRWISGNLGRESNLGDAHQLISSPLGAVHRLGGVSGASNLEKANRILAAPDDRDAVMAQFIGHDKQGRPKRIADIAKTHAFAVTMENPEIGGAGNYKAHPVVNDSWATRSGLWTREQWERAKERASRSNGDMYHYLKFPTKGSGLGLDKPTDKKQFNRATGQWELPDKHPSISEVAARLIGYGGAYERLSNGTRAAAARRGLNFAHEAQAGIWAAISGNKNPSQSPRHDVDLDSIEHPEELYNEMWARRASGLVAPQNPGGLILPDHHHGNDEV